MPSKIVDYLQNHTPIAALSPMIGVINDMYQLGTIDYFADITNSDDIARLFELMYTDFKTGCIGKKSKDIERFRNKSILETQQHI